MRICRVVTVPITFETLYREQLAYVAHQGIDVTLVSSPGVGLSAIAKSLNIDYHPIHMARKIEPFHDVYALIILTKLLRRKRFDIVHSSTPKAGFLAALAGVLARVPIRIHMFTGQVWIGMQGVTRKIMKLCDWIIGHLNTQCYADSASQRDFLVNEKLVSASKLTVLGTGSVSGVDLKRFNPKVFGKERVAALRRELGITRQSSVILFVGRLTKDKGIRELISAFQMLQKDQKDVDLILVGPFEPERDPLPQETLNKLSANQNIHVIGFCPEPETYMAISDVLCLPSYREGFGSVVIEAAVMGVPSVASAVVGLVDAVVDGETGLLVPVKNAYALKQALSRMISEPMMRRRMGHAARRRAVRHFDSKIINNLLLKEYKKLITKS